VRVGSPAAAAAAVVPLAARLEVLAWVARAVPV